MVQSAQPRAGNHGRVRCRFLLDRSTIRSVLCQGIVNPVFMMIVDVVADQPAKVLLIQRDHVIENFPAARSYPALRNSVLLRRLHVRLLRFQSRSLQESDHTGIELRIAIEDSVTILAGFGEGLTQLIVIPKEVFKV